MDTEIWIYLFTCGRTRECSRSAMNLIFILLTSAHVHITIQGVSK